MTRMNRYAGLAGFSRFIAMAARSAWIFMQQGVVDAQENPLPTIEARRFHEVQSHISLTGHITHALLTIVAAHTREMMSREYYAHVRGYGRDTIFRGVCSGRRSSGPPCRCRPR